MKQSDVGVAIVGTGFGQKVHLPAFEAHHRTKVVAIYHRDRDKATAIAQANKIPHACTSIEAIAALPDVQVVSIATPPFLHFSMAKTALLAHKHVLIEKPLTLTAHEAEELYHIAAANRLITAVNFEFRCIPAWMQLAELLQTGYVGKVRFVKIDWLVSSRADASRPWNWYAQKSMGGGALGAIGSHAFDYVHWLFGGVKQLSARLSVSVPQRPDPATGELKPVDADDICQLMLELADGTPCQMNLSAATYQGRGHWVEVYGDRGTLVLGSSNLKDYVHGFQLWGSQAGATLEELPIPTQLEFPRTFDDGRIAPTVRIIDRLVQGIDQGMPLTPSLKEGVASQQLMDLAHQSNQLGSWVSVPASYQSFL